MIQCVLQLQSRPQFFSRFKSPRFDSVIYTPTMPSEDKPTQAGIDDTRRYSDAEKNDAQHLELAHDADSTHLEKAAANIQDIATSVDNIPVSWFVWLVALTASTAGMLFGYDTGIISAAELYLGTDLNNRQVTSNEKEMITSLCSAGAFVGAIFAGNTADRVRVHRTSLC